MTVDRDREPEVLRQGMYGPFSWDLAWIAELIHHRAPLMAALSQGLGAQKSWRLTLCSQYKIQFSAPLSEDKHDLGHSAALEKNPQVSLWTWGSDLSCEYRRENGSLEIHNFLKCVLWIPTSGVLSRCYREGQVRDTLTFENLWHIREHWDSWPLKGDILVNHKWSLPPCVCSKTHLKHCSPTSLHLLCLLALIVTSLWSSVDWYSYLKVIGVKWPYWLVLRPLLDHYS